MALLHSWTALYTRLGMSAASDDEDHDRIPGTEWDCDIFAYRAQGPAGLRCIVKAQASAASGKLVAVQAFLLSPCCGEPCRDTFSFFSDEDPFECTGCGAGLALAQPAHLVVALEPEAFGPAWQPNLFGLDCAPIVTTWLETAQRMDPLQAVVAGYDVVQELRGLAERDFTALAEAEAGEAEAVSLEALQARYSGPR